MQLCTHSNDQKIEASHNARTGQGDSGTEGQENEVAIIPVRIEPVRAMVEIKAVRCSKMKGVTPVERFAD